MRTPPAALRTMLAVAVAALLTGCAHDVGDLDAEDSPVARYDWDPADGGDEALMQGTLELRDGCLYIQGTGDTEGIDTIPVLTRRLASWDAEHETLTYAGIEYSLGDEVAAGGGWGGSTAGMAIPEGCTGDVMRVQDTSLEPMIRR